VIPYKRRLEIDMDFLINLFIKIRNFLKPQLWVLVPGAINPKILAMRDSLSKLSYEKSMLEFDLKYLERDLKYEKKENSRYKADVEYYRDQAQLARDENWKLRSEMLELRLNNINRGGRYTYSGPTPQLIPLFYLSKDAPKEVFDAVYKTLARKYHPDTGNGSQELMKQLNDIKDQVYSAKAWK
jgi:hypothetical protein